MSTRLFMWVLGFWAFFLTCPLQAPYASNHLPRSRNATSKMNLCSFHEAKAIWQNRMPLRGTSVFLSVWVDYSTEDSLVNIRGFHPQCITQSASLITGFSSVTYSNLNMYFPFTQQGRGKLLKLFHAVYWVNPTSYPFHLIIYLPQAPHINHLKLDQLPQFL